MSGAGHECACDPVAFPASVIVDKRSASAKFWWPPPGILGNCSQRCSTSARALLVEGEQSVRAEYSYEAFIAELDAGSK